LELGRHVEVVTSLGQVLKVGIEMQYSSDTEKPRKAAEP
jgi:hypothetical protein